MNQPQPAVAINGDPASDVKLTIDGRDYRRVRGALTWEWRRGPMWAYVMEPEVSAALDALVVEMEPCDDCGLTAKRCFVSRLAGRSGCCPDCGHVRARRHDPLQQPTPVSSARGAADELTDAGRKAREALGALDG